MITEDYVSFETAKLLKKKGFNEKCISVYHDGELQLVSSLGIFCGEGYGEQILTYTNSECEWSPIMISAPTLQMTMKWLRKVYGLFIRITEDMTGNVFEWSVYQKNYGCKASTYVEESYEQACEVAIKYCLEHLI